MAETRSRDTDDVKAQIKTISDDVAALSALVREIAASSASDAAETLKGKADDMAGQAREMKDKASRRAREEIGALEQQIVDKPLQSALIAFVIGAVIGALTRR